MIVPSGANDPRKSLLALLRPYPDQHPVQSVLVAAFAVGVWSATFVAAITMLGGESVATADTAAAVQTWQFAGVLAGVGCGAYLGVAFARERGGPVTNLLFAPLSAAVGATGAPIETIYITKPAGVFSATAGSGAVGYIGGGVGTVIVLASATVVTVVVAAVHFALVAGPAHRRLVEARFAALSGVHFGPRPFED